MKALYISIFLLGALLAQGQTALYNKLHSFLSNQTKEIVSNRMIAINVWSANDKNSRDMNVEFDKAYKTYDYAKLKGGNSGIIVLNINLDSDAVNSDIILKKDGITKMISIPSDNEEIYKELKDKAAGYNIVFDSNGNVVYENLDTKTVFNSIHQLITR